MKLKRIFFCILLLIFSVQIFSQPRKEREQFINHIILSEIYKIPSGEQDSTEQLYYIYKIPYNRLVFEKSDDHYTASYRLTVEIHDSSANNIIRKIKEDKISVTSFEETDEANIYTEGLLSFQISTNKKYNLFPILFDENSSKEIRLNKTPIFYENGKNNQDEFLEPLVVNFKQKGEGSSSIFTISNFDGYIPFAEEEYDLLIPCSDTALQKLYVSLINNEDTVFTGDINDAATFHNSIEEKNGKIILSNNDKGKVFKNFIFPFINKKIFEGELTINISKNDDSESHLTFNKKVRWIDKPFSSMNPESAINFLKYMESDSVIDSLLDFKKKDYAKILFNYWKRFDPTPETSFNELMNEYYSRIDYTLKHFSSLSGKRGFDTDRGKIFILYGKPSELERTSNQFGKVVETWIYKNPERKFLFIDETGTGEYQLKNG